MILRTPRLATYLTVAQNTAQENPSALHAPGWSQR
jgi:hypothetical protein